MNIDLKSDRGSFQRCVLRRRMNREETAEAIVPDAQPDILRILDTQGFMCLRGKDSSDGRVTVTGTAELTVLYVPESGGGVRKISVSVPMELTADCPEELGEALISADLTLTGADARTVNPRKVVVRAECACDAALYMPDAVCSTQPREREGVYFKSAKETLRLPVSVAEKTFVITDEARLPDNAPAIGELLRTRTALTLESVRAVGSRAVLKGAAVTEALYEAREGGLCRETLTSPFSQIVETDAPGEAADFDVTLSVTGFYVSRSLMEAGAGEVLSLEIHAVAQCTAYADLPVERVTDAYCVTNPMDLTSRASEAEVLVGRETLTREVELTIPTAERAAKVLAVCANVASQAVRRVGEGSALSAALMVSVLYENGSGEVLAAQRRAETEIDLAAPNAQAVLTVPGDPSVQCRDTCLEIRAEIRAEVTGFTPSRLEWVDSVEIDEDTPLDKSSLPSVSVVRCADPDLWELAKAHLSTPEMILEASGLEPACTPEKGTLLLVPRI